MKLILRDSTLRVLFFHEVLDPVKTPSLAGYSHMTTCLILWPENVPLKEAKTISTGITKCHRSDQFNRAIGRKIAFRNALAVFTRAQRTEMWSAMFEARTHARCRPWTI